jgi:protein CpxP
MKTLIKSLKVLALMAVLISGTQAFAQEKADKRQHTEMSKEKRAKRFEEASKKLNLTADQQTKIKALLEKNKEEMKALREANKDKPKEEKRKLMVAQLKKLDGQIVAVLDAKQQETYKQMRAEKKAEMKKKKAERDEMQEELGDAGISIF